MLRKKVLNRLMSLALVLCMVGAGAARAAITGPDGLAEGSYPIEAELSCYINAMGGVEFGAPLLTGAQLNVAQDGSETITLRLGKSSVTIYGVTCDTFVDAAPAYSADTTGPAAGTIGYYDADGTLQTDGVTHTLSSDTALNAQSEAVHYVDSITFPVTHESDDSGFVNINPEDVVQKEPDQIFVFAHYAEEDAFAFMEKEFAGSSTWQHFKAVQAGRIVYLPSRYFGMSASLDWTQALEYLAPYLQGADE